MPKITYVQPGGEAQVLEGDVGKSVMEVATANLVPGIIGECGGCCSCATCHVHVADEWFDKLPPADELELAMLEGAIEPGPKSRLSCQLKIDEKLDGLVVRIPAGQVP